MYDFFCCFLLCFFDFSVVFVVVCFLFFVLFFVGGYGDGPEEETVAITSWDDEGRELDSTVLSPGTGGGGRITTTTVVFLPLSFCLVNKGRGGAEDRTGSLPWNRGRALGGARR